MNYEVMAVEYFRRRLKKLSKKYRRIGEDYKSLIETLEDNPMKGDAIPGFGNKIYKIRMRSSNMKRGKRGGFRVIYYLSNHIVYLLTIKIVLVTGGAKLFFYKATFTNNFFASKNLTKINPFRKSFSENRLVIRVAENGYRTKGRLYL